MDHITGTELGRKTKYPDQYDKSLLYPIARERYRSNILTTHPHCGKDIWTAWEISWLNLKGKPQVAIGVFEISSHSSHIIESKSLKLYLNSLNSFKASTAHELSSIIEKDLSDVTQSQVKVSLYELNNLPMIPYREDFMNIDDLDLSIESDLKYSPQILSLSGDHKIVSEKITSNLLKSNCPVTMQPDWATVFIYYKGQQITRDSILRYLISFRSHNEFHELCTERIFNSIYEIASPDELYVECRYTRRGGIDINPIRTTPGTKMFENQFRLFRQ